MDERSRVYVAGGSGLIGSAILRILKSMGYAGVVSPCRNELDLLVREKVENFFKAEKPEYVFLAAARVGGIFANSAYPADFIYENLSIQTNVIDLAFRHGVKKLIFLASSCVYPKICPQPIKEDYLLMGPIEPTNEPYGVAKIAGIKMCEAYRKQYGANFMTVIAANVYGINDNFTESGHVAGALIDRFHRAKLKNEKGVVIWGSGKPRREFFYVDDLADACVFLMGHDALLRINERGPEDVINAGAGVDTSIWELAVMIKDVVKFSGEIIFDTARPDGIPKRLLDSTRIKALGWRPSTELREGLEKTYRWYLENFSVGILPSVAEEARNPEGDL